MLLGLTTLAIELFAALLSSRGKWSTLQTNLSAVPAKAKLYDSPRTFEEDEGDRTAARWKITPAHSFISAFIPSLIHPPFIHFLRRFKSGANRQHNAWWGMLIQILQDMCSMTHWSPQCVCRHWGLKFSFDSSAPSICVSPCLTVQPLSRLC